MGFAEEGLDKTFGQLQFANGYGGFSEDGKEYIIHLQEGMSTPLPWINVIANAKFGFQVSEVGAGYTWSLNSREYKLTPWSNDPILDPAGKLSTCERNKAAKLGPLRPVLNEKKVHILFDMVKDIQSSSITVMDSSKLCVALSPWKSQ